MAFVAVRQKDEGSEIIGVTRALSDPDNIDAEFAILVRSDLKGVGLGRKLLEKMIQYTRNHGLERLTAVTMPNNQSMINLARKLGFSIDVQMDAGIVNLELTL
jgi:acetyltransferase